MATVTARSASAFRSSAFSRFYAGQALSYLGDGLRTLAIPLLVFRLTGSATAIGWTWGLELGPYALVSLIGGSLADRVDRRRLMIASDALRFAVMGAFSILFATGHLSIGMVYGGVVVLAIGGSIFLGAQMPSLRYILGADGVKSGMSSLVATEQTVGLVAPPLGGALMGIVGPLPALVINTITYLFSQAAIASVPTFGPQTPGGVPTPREIASDVVTGWRHLMADAAIRTTAFYSLFFNLVGSIGFVALIPYFKRAFGAHDAAVGLAFGCFAGGAALGSFVAGRTHWPVGRALVIANLIDGVGWLPLPWAHSMPVAVAGIVVSSACAGYFVTTIISWRMRIVPEDVVGRVFGVVRLIVLIGILPGSVAGGWLADHIGVRETMAISAFGYLITGALMATSRAVRNERR
ncbi:MAG: Permease, MFS-type [Candidatus Eremiobacteraeota bacterium]|nr:Permease, MFS-type [Candidatus Eremiobacteraeota bacterium]